MYQYIAENSGKLTSVNYCKLAGTLSLHNMEMEDNNITYCLILSHLDSKNNPPPPYFYFIQSMWYKIAVLLHNSG